MNFVEKNGLSGIKLAEKSHLPSGIVTHRTPNFNETIEYNKYRDDL